MFKGAIEFLIGLIDSLFGIASDTSGLFGTLKSFSSELYNYIIGIHNNIVMPIGYTILALFALLSLWDVVKKREAIASNSTMGLQIPFMAMFRVAVCKAVLDGSSVILNAIYDLFYSINQKIGDFSAGASHISQDTKQLFEQADWGAEIVVILILVIVLILALVAVAVVNIIILARFVELYVYVAIAPIPMATFANDEFSSIGKNFLKNFASICLQGTLLILVVNMFPVLQSAIFNSATDELTLMGYVVALLGYSLLTIFAVISTSRWSKSILNAM